MKRILVTGGNKGIGKAICERLLQEWDNTHVILTARNAERGKSAVEDIIKTLNCSPERIAFLEMDVSSDESVKAASAAFEKMSAGTALDGIINNAGVSSRPK
jgi:NAD(P)-dependent dehydrogenase (short-subunit alcohol dehydrogenase family)